MNTAATTGRLKMDVTRQRVALVDNDPLTLNLLVQRLPHWVPGTEISWYSDSGNAAIHDFRELKPTPDVLLLDMSLKEHENGVNVCRSIRRENGTTWIFGMISYRLDHYAQDLAEAGAQGIIPKSEKKMLAMALIAARNRKTYNPLETNAIAFDTPEEAHKRLLAEQPHMPPRLSPQEQQIFDLLSRGFDYAAIAQKLGVTQSSVRTQTHRAVKKLGANTLAHALVLWVMQDEHDD